jgi:hypothetical protein
MKAYAQDHLKRRKKYKKLGFGATKQDIFAICS